MTNLTSPPAQHPVVDQNAIVSLPWLLHFNSLYEGDTGKAWTPTFQSLSTVGTPTISGRYYRLIRRICYFTITIVPGTSTTSTAGTTYIDNFPLTFSADGICFAVSGGLGSSAGHVIASNNRIYVPAWSAVTVPLTIVGACEVRS